MVAEVSHTSRGRAAAHRVSLSFSQITEPQAKSDFGMRQPASSGAKSQDEIDST